MSSLPKHDTAVDVIIALIHLNGNRCHDIHNITVGTIEYSGNETVATKWNQYGESHVLMINNEPCYSPEPPALTPVLTKALKSLIGTYKLLLEVAEYGRQKEAESLRLKVSEARWLEVDEGLKLKVDRAAEKLEVYKAAEVLDLQCWNLLWLTDGFNDPMTVGLCIRALRADSALEELGLDKAPEIRAALKKHPLQCIKEMFDDARLLTELASYNSNNMSWLEEIMRARALEAASRWNTAGLQIDKVTDVAEVAKLVEAAGNVRQFRRVTIERAPKVVEEIATETALVSHLTVVSSDPLDEELVSTPADSADVMLLLGHSEASGETVEWEISIRANPHLLMVGLPGMGKTTCLIHMCEQLRNADITPVVFSYHHDLDEQLTTRLENDVLAVNFNGLGFNPMQVTSDHRHAFLDNAGMLRDIFSTIFPDLGEIQLGRIRDAIKQSYLDCGWTTEQRGETPAFRTFFELLLADPKQDRGLLMRLGELDDFGFFTASSGAPSLLETTQTSLIRIHELQNEVVQRAFSTFVLHNVYQNMFRRGLQQRITHAVIFDEAHRAAKLKLIPTMAKECRKYGIAFIVASQEAKDFDDSLFKAIANYLALRVGDSDARRMAKIFAPSEKINSFADHIKQMPKYQALFFAEGMKGATQLRLLDK